MRRCHPSSVWGVTTKIDHRGLGGRQLSAASSAVLGLEPRPWVLTAQDGQLVAEDQDLHLFRIRRPPAQHHQLKDAAWRQVDERPDHQYVQRDNSTRRRTIALLSHLL